MSQPKRFSREGFKRLAHRNSDENMAQQMGNPNDATIDIPLTKVTTSKSTGARRVHHTLSNTAESAFEKDAILNEKASHDIPFHRTGGRRKKLEDQGKGASDPDDGTLTAMGRFYDKIYHFSVITRYLLYVAPVALLIAVPIIVGATAAPTARIGGTRIVWFFSWIEIVWCSIWVSKLVSRFLPYIFQFVVGVVSSGTRKYALIMAALEVPLSLVGWALTSLATFAPVMTKTSGRDPNASNHWIDVMTKVLAALLCCTLVLLFEKVLIQLISISYHRKQFDEKIKDSKRNIALVTDLYEVSKAMFPPYCVEFAEEDYIITDVLGLSSLATPGHRRSGSATPMRLIQNVQRLGEGLTSAFGNMASEITGKQLFNPTASHSIVIQALEKRRSSEALARRLWLSYVLEGKDALYLDDLVDVLGHDKTDEAQEIFAALDLDGNGDISLDEMVLRISEFGRERAALANSMRDVDQAITVLDNLLLGVVFIACIFIIVAWLNTNFTTTLATAGTALLSLSFVFSVTAQELLGSCIFLFVKHPYDVGDRVDINKEQLVVEKISLLYTMFKRVQDHKRTQCPNIVLNSQWIDNISRSKAMRETVNIYIAFDTTFEDIELLRKEMQDFVVAKENARDFQSEVDIEVLDLAEMNKLQLKIEIRHKSNWANEQVRAARRSKFMCALVQAIRRVPINGPGGGGPASGDKANPTYSVSISDTEARENKQQFDLDTEAKRLVPTAKPADNPAPSTDFFGDTPTEARERSQAAALNQRNVIIDSSGQAHEDVSSSTMDRLRSNELEEVKNIMRRQSTVGRRKASQVAPRISEETPMTLSTTQQSARVPSYYEDNSHGASSSAAAAPHIQVTESAPSQLQPLRTQSLAYSGHNRTDSNVRSPDSNIVPGNAFSMSQHQQQQQSPPRRPMPGIGQMKGHLQGSGEGPSAQR